MAYDGMQGMFDISKPGELAEQLCSWVARNTFTPLLSRHGSKDAPQCTVNFLHFLLGFMTLLCVDVDSTKTKVRRTDLHLN